MMTKGVPHSSVGKESPCHAGDPSLIPGLGRFHREGNGNPLQYSCVENPVDKGAYQAIAHQTRLSDSSSTMMTNLVYPVGKAIFLSSLTLLFSRTWYRK